MHEKAQLVAIYDKDFKSHPQFHLDDGPIRRGKMFEEKAGMMILLHTGYSIEDHSDILLGIA